MAGLTDVMEQNLLNHLFTDPAYTPPANWFVALSSTTPAEDGSNFTEPSTGAYARVSTAAADWAAAAGTAPAIKDNVNAITFPTATADWVAAANLTHFGLFEAGTGGTVRMWGALTTPKPCLSGDTMSFPAGTLDVKLGDPGDSY
jgi:hypothetical protein